MTAAVDGPSADDLLAGVEDPLVAVTLGSVRVLIINRPRTRNALSLEMRKTFARLIGEAEADVAIHVVIVTGAGGNFSSGVDLSERQSVPRPPLYRPHPAEAVRAMTKPVIAAVDGPCVTGALELALSCSFIIASDRARFADTHAKVGLFPAWGQSALLPRAIGVRRARQMSITGAFVDAWVAYEWGLANEVVSPERLMTRCFEIAREITAANSRSVTAQLDLMRRHDGAPLETALTAEAKSVERWIEAMNRV